MKILLAFLTFTVSLLLLSPVATNADTHEELAALMDAIMPGSKIEDYGHCGFRFQFYIRQHFDELSPEHQVMAAKIIAAERPEREFTHISPNGHFTFYYDTSGTHAIPLIDQMGNGIPDYIDSAAVIFDHVWDVEINQLGFQPPFDADGNIVQSYPIYITRLPSTYYGQTILEAEIPSLPEINYASYIQINRNLESSLLYTKGLDALRITAAHEFNHALQLCYRMWEDNFANLIDLYFMEMTSVWLEEYVFDSINDYYQYLPTLFNSVSTLRFTNGYGTFPYGNSIYLQMIEAMYGPQFIVEVWERIRLEPAIEALDHVLQQHGSSWPLSQHQYARWLYFTGDRAVPGFFPEADQYPKISIKDDDQYILNEDLNIESEVKAKTIGYILMENASNIRYITQLESSVDDGYYSHISGINTNDVPAKFNLDKAFFPGLSDSIALVLSNPIDSAVTITYSIRGDTLLFPGIGPNLISVTTDAESANFFNVPADATIQIFNINGRFVNALKTGERKQDKLSWQLIDQFNQRLASGIYIYIIKAPGLEKIGKFAVVRR